MNKIISSAIIFAMCVCGGTTAFGMDKEELMTKAEEVKAEVSEFVHTGVYVEPKMGMTFARMDDVHADGSNVYSDDDRSTLTAGISVGYDFTEKFEVPARVEVEYMYRDYVKMHTPCGNHKSFGHTAMVNGEYDVTGIPFVGEYVTPYVTAGIGAAWVDDDNANFAYNYGIGMYHNLTENIAIDISSRYFDLGEYHKHGYKADVDGVSTMVGVRYKF